MSVSRDFNRPNFLFHSELSINKILSSVTLDHPESTKTERYFLLQFYLRWHLTIQSPPKPKDTFFYNFFFSDTWPSRIDQNQKILSFTISSSVTLDHPELTKTERYFLLQFYLWGHLTIQSRSKQKDTFFYNFNIGDTWPSRVDQNRKILSFTILSSVTLDHPESTKTERYFLLQFFLQWHLTIQNRPKPKDTFFYNFIFGDTWPSRIDQNRKILSFTILSLGTLDHPESIKTERYFLLQF